MNVESVAWIIERKDVLSGLFYLLALFMHPNANTQLDLPSPRTNGRALLLSLLFYTLAMLSKTIVITLPAVLLLIPWAIRGTISVTEALRATPFIVLGLLLGAHDAMSARAGEPVDFQHTLLQKLFIASRAVCFYLSQLLWPSDQQIIYQRWNVQEDGAIWVSCFLFIATLLVTLFFSRNTIGRAPLASLLFFGGTLFPVLGLIDFGFMSFSFVADRFQYLASIGPIVCFSAMVIGMTDTSRLDDHTGTAATTTKRWLIPSVLVAILASRTFRHVSVYQNNEAFWSYIVSANPTARSAHLNHGNEMRRQKEWLKAEPCFQRALQQDPHDLKALTNYAATLTTLSRPEEAIPLLERALEVNPTRVSSLNGLGNAYSGMGQREDAIKYFKKVIDLDPNSESGIKARANTGNELARLGRYEEAVPYYEGAIAVKPTYTNARKSLAVVLRQLGRNVEAAEQYRQVLEYDPTSSSAREELDMLEGNGSR